MGHTRLLNAKHNETIPMRPEDVYKLIEDMRRDNERVYVRLERYLTVERIVFGLVGIALFAVFSSIMALVLRTK